MHHPPPSAFLPLALPPFVGKLGRAELEATAAVLTVACAQNGNTWDQAITEEMFRGTERSPEIRALRDNPFVRLDIFALAMAGYIEAFRPDGRKLSAEDCGPLGTVRFTAKFFDAMGIKDLVS
jgi:hypothetical protein